MKTVIAVALCLCLLLAPLAQSQSLADTVIKGCTSGMTSSLCKGAISRATQMCKTSKNPAGDCVGMLTSLCNVSLVSEDIYLCYNSVLWPPRGLRSTWWVLGVTVFSDSASLHTTGDCHNS